jgi:hypothetical protein
VEQNRNTDLVFWVCRPFTCYAQGMNHRTREMENRLDTREETSKKNTDDLKKVEEKKKTRLSRDWSVGQEKEKKLCMRGYVKEKQKD